MVPIEERVDVMRVVEKEEPKKKAKVKALNTTVDLTSTTNDEVMREKNDQYEDFYAAFRECFVEAKRNAEEVVQRREKNKCASFACRHAEAELNFFQCVPVGFDAI